MAVPRRDALQAAEAGTAKPMDDLDQLAAEVAEDPVALAAYEDAVHLEPTWRIG
jgi:hypothetical protein